MEKQQQKFKILMFPWLAHGHISPYLELSKKLSTTKHFDLYLCSTAVNLDSIRSTLAKHKSDPASVKLVQLHMPSSPELPPELHTTKNVSPNLLPALIQAFQLSISSFSEIMDSLKPDLLLYDSFQPWAPKIASSKGIPCVFFAPTSATPYSFTHHVYTMGTESTFPFQNINIPGVYETLKEVVEFLRSLIKDAEEKDEYPFGNFARSTDVVLVNGCRELEGKYADHLSVLCNKKVVFSGPMIADDRNAKLDDEASEIMKWLSGKEVSSTAYISFGSECYLSKEQIAEIAKALELCHDVNFIWVLRSPAAGVEEELPAGFVERVGGRGVVVKWAPQTKILAHPSIGAIVSHSGWNSIMESVYFGVPVVAIPMQYEQPYNARLVVEAGAGVEVERDGGGCYGGEALAKAIEKVMKEKTFCEEVKSRAKMLSENIRKNEEQGMNDVAEELLRICTKNVN